MAAAHRARRCAYITPVGTRCGSPAMQNDKLCYYHDRYSPKPGYRNLPPLEDANSLQCAIQEVLEDLLAGLIDYKRAALVLYGLQTACVNLKRMRPVARNEIVTGLEEESVESPRPPQHVRHGLSRAERAEMRLFFPESPAMAVARPPSAGLCGTGDLACASEGARAAQATADPSLRSG